MKELNFETMEGIQGGITKGCGLAMEGLGLTMIGAFASFATLNPLGIVLGVGGIYAGFPGMLLACKE